MSFPGHNYGYGSRYDDWIWPGYVLILLERECMLLGMVLVLLLEEMVEWTRMSWVPAQLLSGVWMYLHNFM